MRTVDYYMTDFGPVRVNEKESLLLRHRGNMPRQSLEALAQAVHEACERFARFANN